MKAAAQAQEWAKKREAQMERARLIREERKQQQLQREGVSAVTGFSNQNHNHKTKPPEETKQPAVIQMEEPEVEIPEFLRGYKDSSTRGKPKWVSSTDQAQPYNYYEPPAEKAPPKKKPPQQRQQLPMRGPNMQGFEEGGQPIKKVSRAEQCPRGFENRPEWRGVVENEPYDAMGTDPSHSAGRQYSKPKFGTGTFSNNKKNAMDPSYSQSSAIRNRPPSGRSQGGGGFYQSKYDAGSQQMRDSQNSFTSLTKNQQYSKPAFIKPPSGKLVNVNRKIGSERESDNGSVANKNYRKVFQPFPDAHSSLNDHSTQMSSAQGRREAGPAPSSSGIPNPISNKVRNSLRAKYAQNPPAMHRNTSYQSQQDEQGLSPMVQQRNLTQHKKPFQIPNSSSSKQSTKGRLVRETSSSRPAPKRPPGHQLKPTFNSPPMGGGGSGGDDIPIRPMQGGKKAFFTANDDEFPSSSNQSGFPGSGGGYNYTQKQDQPDEYAPTPQLHACPSCGRKFNYESYQKHIKNCNQVFNQKRKVFNSQAHRVENAEQKAKMKQGARKDRQIEQQKAMAPAPKWKLQSMQFRMALMEGKKHEMEKEQMKQPARGFGKKGPPARATRGGRGGGGARSNSRGMNQDMSSMMGYSAQEMAQLQQFEAQMDTRVPCKHCGRKFNEEAATRHIPFCAKKAKENMIKKFK